jgi:hypothetical protein
MPIWLRNFTFNKLKEYYESKNKQKDTVEESIKNMKAAGSVSKNKITPPQYVTKASKK